MGAEGRRRGASVRGTSDWTQASCPELVPAAGSASLAARSALACVRQPPSRERQGENIYYGASAYVFQNKCRFVNYCSNSLLVIKKKYIYIHFFLQFL